MHLSKFKVKYLATWARKLDTGDSRDLKLVKNTNY
jgi:hypothetical protein